MATDRMQFTDRISMSGCEFILALSDEKIKEMYREDRGKDWEGDKVYTPEQYLNTVRTYCKKWLQEGFGKEYLDVPQKYHYAKERNSGRIYVDGFGLNQMSKMFREILTDGLLYDIDIKNCHPNVLLKMVRQYNKTYPQAKLTYKYLKTYCLSRESVLKDSKLSKQDVLKCLNSDRYDGVAFGENQFLEALHNEKSNIFDAFLSNADFMKPYVEANKADITPKKHSSNPISSQINFILCIEENRILQSVIAPEHNIITPFFDGFMLATEYKPYYDKLLDETGEIMWNYNENQCKLPSFHHFKTFMELIDESIQDGHDVDGAVLDHAINWLMECCGKNILYSNNAYYTIQNNIYQKGANGNQEVYDAITTYLYPHVHQRCKILEHLKVKANSAFKLAKYEQVGKQELLLAKNNNKKAEHLCKRWELLRFNIDSIQKKNKVVKKFIRLNSLVNADLYTKLDSHRNLIAFQNCVFDLNTLSFRDIRKDDYISITTGYDYKEPTEEEMNDFNTKYLFKTFVDEDVRKHFLKTLCGALDGTNRRRKLHIWNEAGNNGKSMTMKGLQAMLGAYFGTMSCAVLQNKRAEAGQASPQLNVLKNCRVVAMNEPEVAKSKLSGTILKTLTGQDGIAVRQLYGQEPVAFLPMASLFMLANVIPDLDRNDSASLARLDITPFESTFGTRPNARGGYRITKDDYKAKEFVGVHGIEDMLKSWRCCFFKTIVSHYREYDADPEFTLQCALADEYRNNQDLVQQFINEKMRNEKGSLTLLKDVNYHLNQYLAKMKTDLTYTTIKLGKYLREHKFITGKGGCAYNYNTCLFDYKFDWE